MQIKIKEAISKWRLFGFQLSLSLVTAIATVVIPISGLGIDPLKMAPAWFVAGICFSLPFAWFNQTVSKFEAEIGWIIGQLILAWYFVSWVLTFQNPNDLGFVTLITIAYVAFLVLGGVTIDSFFMQERF